MAKKIPIDLGREIVSREHRRVSKNKDFNVDGGTINEISSDIKRKIDISEDITSIFPDIQIGMDIVVASILSPNDMIGKSLNYKIKNLSLPTEVNAQCINTISEHMIDNYNILENLSKIVRETLYTKGSYGEIIIPINIVNEMSKRIVTGNESSVSSLIANSNNGVFKNVEVVNNINITNDLSILESKERIINKKKEDYLNLVSGNENNIEKNITDDDIGIFLDSDFREDGVGENRPIIKHIDSEFIIPVPYRNDSDKYYGFFILLDDGGNYLSGTETTTFGTNINNTENEVSKILATANNLIKTKNKKSKTLKNMDELRDYLLTKPLKKAMETLDLPEIDDVNANFDNEIFYNIVVDRFLSSKKTNILFIPDDFMTYYTIETDKNGIGISILEKISVLASMRAMTMFVTFMSFIKSSIPMTKIDVDLDEDDENPELSKELITSEIMKSKQLGYPLGILKANDIVNWLHKLGININFNHQGLPANKIDVSEYKSDISPVNEDLKEKLDKYILRSIGVSPELIDNGYGPDFATIAANNSILFSKRIMDHQKPFNKNLTSHIQKVLKLDGVLKNKLKMILEPNLKNIKKIMKAKVSDKEKKKMIDNYNEEMLLISIMNKLISRIAVSLPEPIVGEDENLSTQFKNYGDRINDVLDVIFDEDMLPDDIIGDFSDKIGTLKKLVKTIVIKRWLSENNYSPELMKVFTIGEDGKPLINLLDEYKTYVSTIEDSVMPFIKNMAKIKNRIDDKLEKIENDEEEEEEVEDNGTGDSENDVDNIDSSDDIDAGDDVDNNDTDVGEVEDTDNVDEDTKEDTDNLESEI